MKRIKGCFTSRVLKGILCLNFVLGGVVVGKAQDSSHIKSIPFGDMDNWLVRVIEESFVIGGKTKTLHEIAPADTIRGAIAYRHSSQSPWRTSNVMAHVSGITKCSNTVFPEKRGEGQCARLETRMENCKVFGIVNITVLASGTIFLGEMLEPIKDTKNPQAKLNMGIPFTERPLTMVFDYKMKTNGDPDRIKAPGFGRTTKVPGKDCAEVFIILQKRWEDEKGNVHAKRIATGVERLSETTPDWVNNHSIKLIYGDASKDSGFQPCMDLIPADNYQYCLNSKGKSVPIIEEGWGDPDDTPTHLILKISSSHGEAYVGSLGNTFWVDNVRFAY